MRNLIKVCFENNKDFFLKRYQEKEIRVIGESKYILSKILE